MLLILLIHHRDIQIVFLWKLFRLQRIIVMSLCVHLEKWGRGLLRDAHWVRESVLLALRAWGEGIVPVLETVCYYTTIIQAYSFFA